MFNPWPHQVKGLADVLARLHAGVRRVCLTSPTGGGKTWIIQELIKEYDRHNMNVVLYSTRRLLTDQISNSQHAAGIEHGVRAAGHEDRRELAIQISSLPTEASRSPERAREKARKAGKTNAEAELAAKLQGERWKLHAADLVLVDEAHIQKGETAKRIFDAHENAGARIVGITATPVNLRDFYDELVTAGTVSELRACGALLPCRVYGPDEPDLRGLKSLKLGENLSAEKIASLIGTGKILFGRVWDNWNKLNPNARPTILFASGIEESQWFAEEFTRRGVRACHIDGQDVWMDGVLSPGTPERRRDAIEEAKAGRIKLICNRFVFREGIDAPWLYHGILATVIGQLSSYLQCVGRLLRTHPTMDSVILQDHGGHWWRHGSPNADRQWDLNYTDATLAAIRKERMASGSDDEPRRCPKCNAIMLGRTVCAFCGYTFDRFKRSRPVIQTDGTLSELEGPIFKPQKLYQAPTAADDWKKMYWRARNSKMTFAQARAYFARLNGWYWPSRSLPFMPYDENDMYRKVRDVAFDRLIDPR